VIRQSGLRVATTAPREARGSGVRAESGPGEPLRLPWHALASHEVLAAQRSSPQGLGSEEVRGRRAVFGMNVLRPRAAVRATVLLWRQLRNPLIYVLVASGGLALLLGKTVDGLVVLGVVVLNTLIGFAQESRALRAIAALASQVTHTATVVRDGRPHVVPAVEIVPGDVVLSQPGDLVAADIRLLEVHGLQAIEASLTGESAPVAKALDPVDASAPLGDRASMLYAGTLIASGSGSGVVVATGASTELGRISELLGETEQPETPLNRTLARVGRHITIAIVGVSALLFGVGLLREYPLADAVLVAVTLAVAAIPEGLPTIVTIALAIGVHRMAARRAIVRSLPAVETLGSTTVICTDKTGTLTRNEMTVNAIWARGVNYGLSGAGYAPTGELSRDGERIAAAPGEVVHVAVAGVLCNDSSLAQDGNAWRLTGDPTEAALLVAARKIGVDPDVTRTSHPRLDVIPFDSAIQLMATLNETPDARRRVYVKGAPEAVLPRCARDALSEAERQASKGERMLAFAFRDVEADRERLSSSDVEDGLSLLGLVGMIDPPRESAVEAVAACQRAGITVKMITGDHGGTARAIAQKIGLCANGAVLTGPELDSLDDAGLIGAAARVDVFARVAPEHKLRLVRALQARDEVTAMTGDGVNDAPALRQADIGVAMGVSGTAAAREAADIVLADDNFATIVAAVEEGRRVFDNLRKGLAFLLPTNAGQVFLVLVPVLAFPIPGGVPLLPLAPVHILWVNLVVAVGLALPLALEPGEPDAMRRAPRASTEPLLGRDVLLQSWVVALLMAVGGIGLFLFEYRPAIARGGVPALALREAQTAAVTTVILLQCLYVLECRSLTRSIFALGPRSNPWIYAGIGGVVLLQLAFVYLPVFHFLFGSAPIGASEWLRSVLTAVVVIPVVEAYKAYRLRATRNARPGHGDQRGMPPTRPRS
jgi:magnesium-transporting ATPase (P-type)